MHGICHTQEHIYVTSNFCYVHSDAQFHWDIQLPPSWTNLSGDFMPLSYSNQDHTFMGDNIIPVLKQQTRLLPRLQRRITTQTFNNALTVVTYIPLRHLAAIIPSQLNYYFLPSFLPSNETCSIKVPFILAAIKTILKNFFISWFNSFIHLLI